MTNDIRFMCHMQDVKVDQVQLEFTAHVISSTSNTNINNQFMVQNLIMDGKNFW